MMPSMPGFRSRRFVRPKRIAVGVTDGDDVLTIRCARQDESLCVCLAADDQTSKRYCGCAHTLHHGKSSWMFDGNETCRSFYFESVTLRRTTWRSVGCGPHNQDAFFLCARRRGACFLRRALARLFLSAS